MQFFGLEKNKKILHFKSFENQIIANKSEYFIAFRFSFKKDMQFSLFHELPVIKHH